MAKLVKAKAIKHYIGEVEVEVKKAPAFKVASAIRSLEGIKSESMKTERMLDIYLQFIVDYTDLENDKEDLKEILTFDELMELGDMITGTSETTKKANFTK
jgi:hypothetical protein